jgi:type I restriction enzyme M protein
MSDILKRGTVLMLNPRTCGIYKSGGPRYKVDQNGRRSSDDIDNELIEHIDLLLEGQTPPGTRAVSLENCMTKRNLTPRYYDKRWEQAFDDLLSKHKLEAVTLGDLESAGEISIKGGHGSPSNDQRIGDVPYIKVSDIRHLRININPTNLIPMALAERFWRGTSSRLKQWDLITPNRASSNIGEFAILMPGEEDVVLTKEVFIIRALKDDAIWTPFYLLWSLSLRAVRLQWQRVALMQTNREDVGQRYREIRLPKPKNREWAKQVAEPFQTYFTTVAQANGKFGSAIATLGFDFIPSVRAVATPTEAVQEEAEEQAEDIVT